MNNLPGTITREEGERYDEYTGPLEDLIAAGLVRRDQLPPAGRDAISWRNGVQVNRNTRIDEHYQRVILRPKGQAVVRIGVPSKVAKPRGEAVRAKWKEEWQRKTQEKDARQLADAEARRLKVRAEGAQEILNHVLDIDSVEAYRRYTAQNLRQSVQRHFNGQNRKSLYWHGYAMTPESVEAIVLAADALVDAVLKAEVTVDAEHRKAYIAEQRAIIRAGDHAFVQQLGVLTTPNPSILSGEQA